MDFLAMTMIMWTPLLVGVAVGYLALSLLAGLLAGRRKLS